MAENIIAVYLAAMTIAGLGVMALDKWRAIYHKWRISERTLFVVALLGGSAGTWAGMYLFHHKTRHKQFVIGMPIIFIVQMGIVVALSVVL